MATNTLDSRSRRYALVLGVLTLLFAARVLGQFVVVLFAPGWLPPFGAWYSGLLPYPALLPVQLIMIAVMVRIVRDFARGGGFFVSLGAPTGTIIVWCSYLYATAMVLRLIVTTLLPELQWFSGTIPIAFHFVLAGFLYTLGRYQREADRR
jgi:hypothetical protein